MVVPKSDAHPAKPIASPDGLSFVEIHNPKSRPEPPEPNRQPGPTAYEEAPGSCKWDPFRRGNIEGIRRVELDKP
jgi:hypothetical protein